ncbi:hypothetical protein BHYA_0581g00020 [Botrytis hyacinthi]|uniref:Major facilitator superfamily (MFS) profile domain-containing protein n=1 Tax=Botrytis hyacinthi TaxID=278943 RepID=A0A4Z1G3E6_9HELO|nr:hypothetical protein BHYA_0581g00020 [Botrytis hyacinthi]
MADSLQAKAEAALFDQTNLLPRTRLLIVFSTLAGAFLIAYADQNGIAVALPKMAADLNATDTIAWAGTSTLIANTVFQVLYGRLSDIFGRKKIYLSAVFLLAVGDILCATAQNAPALYFSRGLAGIAMGGINSLTMMIVSDIVTLQQRGYYQGMLGGCIGLGNLIGPFVSAAFSEYSTWRGFFYLLSPLAGICGLVSIFLLPSTMPKGKAIESVKLVDWYGLLTGSVAIIFFLVPFSGAGVYFPWGSAMVIAMLAISGVAAIAFFLVEWKVAVLPLMPLSMFKNKIVAVILLQNLAFGFAYYSAIYYLPIYFQNVRQFSAIISAALLVPFFLAQMIFSVGSGLYISKYSRYGEVIWCGFTLWTLGTGLLIMFDEHTHPAVICVVLAIIGVGVGNVFQPCLIALQAHCTKSQRAVVISNRNLLRGLGGAFGLGCSSLIMQTALKHYLPAEFHYLARSAYKLPDFSSYTAEQKSAVLGSYQKAVRTVFIVITPLMVICLLGCFLIKDQGLQRKDEKVVADVQNLQPVQEQSLPESTDIEHRREEIPIETKSEEKETLATTKVE